MDFLLPVHNTLHDLLGEKLCCWPGIFGMCPEFWLGFCMAWIIIKTKPQAKFYETVKNVIEKSKQKKDDKNKE